MENLKKINEQKFYEIFGSKAEATIKTPSRINIIGEHVDYLGGKVLPAAISLFQYSSIAKSDQIEFYSVGFTDEVKIIDINKDITKVPTHCKYFIGCIKILKNAGYEFSGFKMYVNSFIPIGSGLSSSAAFGISIMASISKLYDLKIPNTKMATLFKKVENNVMGLKNGIMDQFIIANGKANHAMLLDCATLEYEHYPIDFGDYTFVIFDTKKPRNLIDSKYNERVDETTRGLQIINANGHNFKHICEIPFDEYQEIIKPIQNPIIYQRVEYAIEEFARVTEMINAFKSNDVKKMGKILNEGHAGLRDKYEVSCIESDTIQETAITFDEVMGSRMVGAGFGGCLIALLHKSAIAKVEKAIKKKYKEVIGYDCAMYIVDIVDHVE